MRPDWVCYSAGAGTDVSFDLALAQFGCTVDAFDPTPSSQAYVHSLPPHERFRFHPWAVWTHDGELRLYAPRIGDSNFSAVDLDRTRRGLVVPCRSLESIAGRGSVTIGSIC